MSLVGAVDVLSDSERARHPGSLVISAYFDGWSQASGGPPRTFPRYLTREEEETWRDGWLEAKAERAEYGRQETVAAPIPLRRRECLACPVITLAGRAA